MADISVFAPLDPLEGLWGLENRIPGPQIHPDTHSEPGRRPGGAQDLIFDDVRPGWVINSMVVDGCRWLVEGFKTVSGGVLGVDDEEKTVYIYIYI